MVNLSSRFVFGAMVAVAASATYVPSFSSMTAGDWNLVSPGGNTGCALGGKYYFLVQKGATYPQKVQIEFQGGGSCFSWETCSRDEALDDAYVGSSTLALGLNGAVQDDDVEEDDIFNDDNAGLLMSQSAYNPTLGWTKIFVTHCTQDWHLGAKTMVYEDDNGQNDDDNNNDDGNKDDDDNQDEEEDQTLTWNHNGVENANSAIAYLFDYISNPTHVMLSGCGLRPYTAAYYSGQITRHYGSNNVKQTILSDDGVGLLPSSFIQNKFDNWGAGCVVGKLFDDEGTFDIHSDSFWQGTDSNPFTMENMWFVGPNQNKNVHWLLYNDIDDEYAQQMYEYMQDDDNQNQKDGDNDGIELKTAKLLELVVANNGESPKVSVYVVNGEQEQQDDGEDNGEDDGNDNNKGQDERQCYQAGFAGLAIGQDFTNWVKSATSSNTLPSSVFCENGCTTATIADCNGEYYGAIPNYCGVCPDAQNQDDNGDNDDNNNKDDDDDGNGDNNGDDDANACNAPTTPSWAASGSCSSYQQATPTSTRQNTSSKSKGHAVLVTMAILGGFGAAGYGGFVVGKKGLKGREHEGSRLRDDEKPAY